MQRYKEARKSFERAIKADHNHADAYNNLGVTYYWNHNYGGAIRQYQKAIKLKNDAASYYSNLGMPISARKSSTRQSRTMPRRWKLDPDIFNRSSHAGVQASLLLPKTRPITIMFSPSSTPEPASRTFRCTI
jgi:tetratricopeptide (TPR) repeat protein